VKQEDFAHVLRAAANAAEDNNIIVIGSQAILGTYSEDELPAEACLSIEVDIAFLDDPDELKATKVDGAIGEDSRFHETFGIYGQGVGLAVADLPSGWLERCVPVTLQAAYPSTAVCLEAHDIVVAKLSAGREKDYDYAKALIRAGMVSCATLRERAALLATIEAKRRRIVEAINRFESS
jgi:uncharacterized nucleotidyltransferase DUF6036